MKFVSVWLALLSEFCATLGFAQNVPKGIIDSTEMSHWASVHYDSISFDGQFVIYQINDQPQGGKTIVLHSTVEPWELELTDAIRCMISEDSRWAVIECRDGIKIVNLLTKEVVSIAKAHRAQIAQLKKTQFFFYRIDGAEDRLVLHDLSSGKERIFESVSAYDCNAVADYFLLRQHSTKNVEYSLALVDRVDGNLEQLGVSTEDIEVATSALSGTISFCTATTRNGLIQYAVHVYDIALRQDKMVLETEVKIAATKFDNSGTQLIFQAGPKVFYFRIGMASAKLKLAEDALATEWNTMKGRFQGMSFNRDGTKIIFHYSVRGTDKMPSGAPGVNVWSYRDRDVQPVQAHPRVLDAGERYIGAIDVSENGHPFLLVGPQEMLTPERSPNSFDRYIVVSSIAERYGEWAWQKDDGVQVDASWLVSLNDGQRVKLPVSRWRAGIPDGVLFLSPDEKWVVYYDPSKNIYCSFEVATGLVREITRGAKADWGGDAHTDFWPNVDPYAIGSAKKQMAPRGIAGWIGAEQKVLVYDKFDVWALDLTGSQQPINVTCGQGRAKTIEFRLAYKLSGELVAYEPANFGGHEEIIFAAFQTLSKEAGFFRCWSDGSLEPRAIIFGEYSDRSSLRKAKHANVWVLQRSSTCDAPNLFASHDLLNFSRISDVQPQRKFNWHTQELVDWHLPNGELCQGILYKPENLDPGKKYPVIFNVYEEETTYRFYYHVPNWMSTSAVNIPYFTSRGYLVFTPDLHIEIGHVYRKALQCVLAGADALIQKPYVDSSKMAISGMSFGGGQVYYIATHTDRFTVATPSVGCTDFLSAYNSLTTIPSFYDGGGIGMQAVMEAGQTRMGATLWQRPDLYIENTAIFHADKVTAPMLMMTNREDNAVPFTQGLEFYMALRRLGKKAWMLEYDGEGHGVHKPENEVDFTTRYTQFMDHYLKGAPPPKWMTDGIPAKRKGIDDGLELDLSGKEP